MLIERVELLRKPRIMFAQYAIDFGAFILNDATGPVFVMKVKDLFNDVRKRPVPEIMQQSAGATDDAGLRADLVMRAEQVQGPRHQVHNADGMRKAAVFRALVSEQRDAELFDAAQTLKLCRIDQHDDQAIIRQRFIERDDIVERVPIIPLRQHAPLEL